MITTLVRNHLAADNFQPSSHHGQLEKSEASADAEVTATDEHTDLAKVGHICETSRVR